MKKAICGKKPFVNLSLFGSVARGSADAISDLDVVAIVDDGSGTGSDADIVDWTVKNYGKRASVSWYGRKKMEAFFESGDLFAWHLYLESVPLPGYTSIAETFGKPAPFSRVSETVTDLADIFDSILNNLNSAPRNVVFEAGVAYVCIRNIAMAASWILCDRPDFSRNSPFAIVQLEFPLCVGDYEILAKCRIAGQRGGETPEISNLLLATWIRKLSPWIVKIQEKIS